MLQIEVLKGRYSQYGEKHSVELWRTKILGGWLVMIPGDAFPDGVTFVPDPNHTWDGSSIDK